MIQGSLDPQQLRRDGHQELLNNAGDPLTVIFLILLVKILGFPTVWLIGIDSDFT